MPCLTSHADEAPRVNDDDDACTAVASEIITYRVMFSFVTLSCSGHKSAPAATRNKPHSLLLNFIVFMTEPKKQYFISLLKL